MNHGPVRLILDLFCGAGGASVGYQRAFPDAQIVGVDINPQPDYPFRFFQSDALDLPYYWYFEADLIHASPPCQALTSVSNRWRGKGGVADSHPNLIPATRELLLRSRVPYVIENVVGAKKWMLNPIILSGGYFGLGVERPRLFETTFPLVAPPHVKVHNSLGVYGKLDGRRLYTRKDGTIQRAAKTLDEASLAMGIDWMQWDQLKESIPPAYTEWIGMQYAEQIALAIAA